MVYSLLRTFKQGTTSISFSLVSLHRPSNNTIHYFPLNHLIDLKLNFSLKSIPSRLFSLSSLSSHFSRYGITLRIYYSIYSPTSYCPHISVGLISLTSNHSVWYCYFVLWQPSNEQYHI